MQQSSSVIGVCGLCKAEQVGLCYSDLLPKAVVRWIRKAASPSQQNPNPIFVTPSASRQINYRVAEYFLCAGCEGRLNREGENWTLKHAYRGGSTFPLRDELAGAPAVYTLDRAKIINGRLLARMELPRLVYFASSVFWKASARQWHATDHTTQLDFGPYEQRFRGFLLGEQPFPDRAALLINVSGDSDPHTGAIYPYGGGRVGGTKQYRFAIPGMAFWLHLGQLPDVMRTMCAYHSGSLCFAPDLNEMFVRDMGALIAKSVEMGRAPHSA